MNYIFLQLAEEKREARERAVGDSNPLELGLPRIRRFFLELEVFPRSATPRIYWKHIEFEGCSSNSRFSRWIRGFLLEGKTLELEHKSSNSAFGRGRSRGRGFFFEFKCFNRIRGFLLEGKNLEFEDKSSNSAAFEFEDKSSNSAAGRGRGRGRGVFFEFDVVSSNSRFSPRR